MQEFLACSSNSEKMINKSIDSLDSPSKFLELNYSTTKLTSENLQLNILFGVLYNLIWSLLFYFNSEGFSKCEINYMNYLTITNTFSSVICLIIMPILIWNVNNKKKDFPIYSYYGTIDQELKITLLLLKLFRIIHICLFIIGFLLAMINYLLCRENTLLFYYITYTNFILFVGMIIAGYFLYKNFLRKKKSLELKTKYLG